MGEGGGGPQKGLDTATAELLTIEEGLCAQIMHLGPYDDEPATVALLDAFIAEQGLENDMSDTEAGATTTRSTCRIRAAPRPRS